MHSLQSPSIKALIEEDVVINQISLEVRLNIDVPSWETACFFGVHYVASSGEPLQLYLGRVGEKTQWEVAEVEMEKVEFLYKEGVRLVRYDAMIAGIEY